MVKEAEKNAAEDKKRKELIEAKNKADSLIYATEKTLKESADKIPASDKQEVEQAITDLKAALGTDNIDQINTLTTHLVTTSTKIGDAINKSQPEQNTNATAAKEEEKIVDANYEDLSGKES